MELSAAMNYDALIFDLDGTLWNALSVSAEAFSSALKSNGIDIVVTEDVLKKVTGMPFDQCLEKIYPGITDKYPSILNDIDRFERTAIEMHGGLMYPSVVEGIKHLSGHYKIFIVRNCDEWYLQAFLRHSDLADYIIGHDCYGRNRKTKAEMIGNLKVVHGLINPVYIGDTHHDCVSSEACGIDFIYAQYGFGSVATDCISITSFDKLLDLLSAI